MNTISWLVSRIRPYRDYLIPAAVYGMAFGAFYRLGVDAFRIEWMYYWQLLDQVALAEEPVQSLYLLHAQPPLLNTLLALLLELSEVSGITPESWAWCVFGLLGLASTVLLFRILVDVSSSRVLAVVGLILILANPAYHVFQSLFFYPFLLYAFLVAVLFLSLRTLSTGHTKLLVSFAVMLGLVTNTWSLFHPVWAVLAYVLLVALLYLRHRGQGKLQWTYVGASAAVLGVLMVAWPLKNYLVFGQFTFSSWQGYNLSRETEIRSRVLEDYMLAGIVPEPTLEEIAEFQGKHSLAHIDVLSQTLTAAGGRNWNHYVLLEVNEPLKRASIRYRLDNPAQWLRLIGRNYVAWTQASHIQPYLGTFLGPNDPAYQSYARIYDNLFFLDVRPWLEPHAPGLFQGLEVHGRPLPMTVFGVLTFPLLMITALLMVLKQCKGRQFLQAGRILIPWFTLFWLLLIPCLTDGSEGNRMRFAATSYLVVLAAAVTKELVRPSKQ
ncbi:MAG: hypothetical protein ACP5JJ_16095 [Anaerolineae bacterium]